MQGKVILLTGGTGTFGQAFIKDCLKSNPRQIRIFSRDELKQAQLALEVNDSRVEFLLGDIRDYERLRTAFRNVDICIHAAALKRVEKGQRDPQEFIKTNIQGTINVANACLENNIKNAVFISSDKAVSPINVYGGSKFLAEQVWINSNVYRGSNLQTKFSVVRYGNVIGSRGSLLRMWQDQQEVKGSITITDPRMTRFFLTIQQALDLVYLALEIQQGGEIFIPRLRSIPIMELADAVFGKAAQIEYTGNRGGEKLHEVLATEDEFTRISVMEDYCVIHPFSPTWPYKQFEGLYASKFHTSETAEKYDLNQFREFLERTT